MKIRAKKLAEQFNLSIPPEFNDVIEFDERYLPYKLAPVIIQENGKTVLKMMKFSLIPAWSKEPKVKFATHNARLFSYDEKTKKEVAIFSKPTWRAPFTSRHCLVPMTQFIEPIYLGKYAGNMVAFHEPKNSLLVAAGIWEEWMSKETGEIIESFSILTDEPIPFVEKTGHERSPIFLEETFSFDWLDAKSHKPDEWVKLLRKNRADLNLTVDVDRPLAKGWEKRIPK